jgi:hypothetical protein
VPRLILIALLLCAIQVTSPLPRPAAAQVNDDLCFDQTGYCLREPALRAYFSQHGGPTVFGYPVSRLFRLRGVPTQLFQRVGLQVNAAGRVQPLNLLAADILPIRNLQGLPLPTDDPALLKRAPRQEEADFDARTDEFLRTEVPDTFDGRSIGFLQAYRAVGLDDDGRPFGLAIFGWPTSRPIPDPGGSGVVYQRFERAIFRYSPGGAAVQPLLLGDFLKSALTGRDLSAELAQDLQGSPLLRQYNRAAADGLHRPWDLPASDLATAFEPDSAPVNVILNPDGFGPAAGWPLQAPGVDFLPDGYTLTTDGQASLNRGAMTTASDGADYDDFSLVVDATLLEGSPAGYGITVRQTEEGERVTLLVDAGRRLATLYRTGGKSTAVLWAWSPVPALRPPPLVNRWTLRTSGPRLAAWVNGSPLFDLDAGAPRRGTLWLAAVSWGGPSRALFSGLQLSAPP